MEKTTIKVLESLNDGQIMKIEFVDGKCYKLQYPGNRNRTEWEKEIIHPVNGFDQTKFFDLYFEHCVFPEGHSFKPTLDNIKPKHVEVWGSVLRRFLKGDLVDPMGNKGTDDGAAHTGSALGSTE